MIISCVGLKGILPWCHQFWENPSQLWMASHVQKVSICPGYCSSHQLSKYGVPHEGDFWHSNCLIGQTHRQWSHVQSGLDMFVFFNQKYKYGFHNKKCIMISKTKVNRHTSTSTTVSLSKYGTLPYGNRHDNRQITLPLWQKWWRISWIYRTGK